MVEMWGHSGFMLKVRPAVFAGCYFIAGNICPDDVKHFWKALRNIVIDIRVERDSMPMPVNTRQQDKATDSHTLVLVGTSNPRKSTFGFISQH